MNSPYSFYRSSEWMKITGGKDGFFSLPRFGKWYLGRTDKVAYRTVVDDIPAGGKLLRSEPTFILHIRNWQDFVDAKALKNAYNTIQRVASVTSSEHEAIKEYWRGLRKHKGWLLSPPWSIAKKTWCAAADTDNFIVFLVYDEADGKLMGGMGLYYTQHHAFEIGLFSEHVSGLYIADLLKFLAIRFCERKGIPIYDLSGTGGTPGIEAFKKKWSSENGVTEVYTCE